MGFDFALGLFGGCFFGLCRGCCEGCLECYRRLGYFCAVGFIGLDDVGGVGLFDIDVFGYVGGVGPWAVECELGGRFDCCIGLFPYLVEFFLGGEAFA